MKGRTPSAEQKRFWDLLVTNIGCVASRMDGFFDGHCSIHHIDGRTKPNAHWLVLPLSAGNHQDGTGAPGRIAVHPWKARFRPVTGVRSFCWSGALNNYRLKAWMSLTTPCALLECWSKHELLPAPEN